MSYPRDPDAAEHIAAAVRVLRLAAEGNDDPVADLAAHAVVVNVDDLRHANLGVAVSVDDVTLTPAWDNVLFAYRQDFADDTGRWYTNLTHFAAWDETTIPVRPAFEAIDPADRYRWSAMISYFTVVDGDTDAKIFKGRVGLGINDDGAVARLVERDQDGGPLDLDEVGMAEFERRMFIPLFCLDLLACRNVVVVSDPPRPRPVARRIGRTGVTVSEIHILPTGTTRTGTGRVRTIPIGATPLHSVRGHKARYGPKFGRGLLFGRIEGEFWIPHHARGNPAVGTVDQTYEIEPS